MKNIKLKQIFKAKGLLAAAVAFIGFILSPLSYWNDLFVNIPLAFGFAYVIALGLKMFMEISLITFLPLMALGYFLTNVLGFWMIEKAAISICEKRKVNQKSALRKNFALSILAVVLSFASIQFGLLELNEVEQVKASILTMLEDF